MKNKKLLALVGFTIAVLGTAFTAACSNPESGHHHSYTEVITKQASCTEAGEKTFTCDCGDVYTEVIPATGHNYEVESTIPANCTEAEKEHLKCGVCGDEKTQIKEGGQAALGHDWVTDSTIPATCDEPEKEVQSCNRDGCDAEQTVNKENGQSALGHNYVADESTRTQPDCTHDGGVTMKCDHEGCTDSYWHTIVALGHTDDGTKNEVHNPTCEEEGYTVHHCSVCDEDYVTDNQSPLGHDYQADGKVIASCDTIGYDKYTCTHGCGTEKRENIVQNDEHIFNEQGVCTRCEKPATEVMALIARAATPIGIVSVGKGNYEVYGMREKEHVVYIPYNVIEALVKQGVESIIISVGAATPSKPISVVAKIDGETMLSANFGEGQTGEVATVKIAENGQVASTINPDGIALTVYYHDNYVNKVNGYVVGLTYVQTFDSQKVDTWYQTSLEVSGTAEDKVHTFSGMEDQTYYKLIVRPELIKYYAEQGADRIKFSFISKEGQRVIFAVDCNSTQLPTANYSLDVPELEITEELLQNGVNFRVFFADCSLLPEWASSNFDKADGFILQTLLIKDYDANDASTYFDSAASWTANATNNEFAFSNCDIGNNTIIKIRPEYFADLASKGYAQAVITLSSKSGQNLTFSVVLDGTNHMARGSVSFTLDITDELKTNGISLPVYTSDNNGNADGFVMRIDKVYAFDESNPITFICVPGTDGVSYADNVWTISKSANEDFSQQITISKEAVAKWIADGYSVVTLKIVHKDGEILGTQGVQTKWTVALADCVDNGYSFAAYIAPRNEQGGYGNITGFLVSAEFTVAYNEAKPETYIMADGTEGITYAGGVWTVAKTAAYAEDFYQNVTVRPETIAYWMAQGYAKMTFAVSAKSGENTVVQYDGNFVYAVTFTDEMKTQGYTFPHIFIGPRSDSGMTGFNVTIELVKECTHNWDTENITWTWDDTAGATATITCLNGDHPETVTASVALTTDTPATCTADGQKVYTATITFKGNTYTDTKTETLSKLGHNYDTENIVWTWEGYTDATATITCLNADHPETVTASVEVTTNTPATCTTDGQKIYTATITFDGKTYTDTKTETLSKLGHSYGEWTVTKEATAEEDGKREKVCSVCNDKVTEKIPALGHIYDTENIAWAWNGFESATATFTCTTESEHTVPVTASITVTSTTPATCTTDGQKVYTATVEFNGQTYTDTKTETLTKLGHSYGTPVRVEPTEDKEGSITEICSVCNDKKITVIPAYLSAPGTDGVSYADNVWTFSKSANEDFNQQIIISKEAVAKWMADGYSVVTLKIVHKDGEILGTQGVQTKWTVALADCVDNGYSFTAYIAPRNEQGGYGNITGFLVSAEFTVAYNEAKPETYIMADGTEGITYAGGVWTVAKTAAYAEDFYQNVTVRPETIAYWMAQGYAKMTFAVSAKSGENTVVQYDGNFVYTVTFTDEMKTQGYTFPHVFIGPRSDRGMTGFNVTLELTETFDENKPEKFITAEGAERSAYADNVWTFDREGEYYDQYFTVKAEVVQKWIADGYAKMIIEIKSKDGESLNQNPVFNIVSRWEVALAEYATTGFTDKTFIAPNSGTVTGFKIQVTLVESFDVSKMANQVTANGTEGVTYENNVWTFARNAGEDFNQTFTISADAIKYWQEQGKTDMWVVLEPKLGEYLDFRNITNSWCVSLSDYTDGFSQTVYMPPRNSALSEGSTISGFRIVVVLFDKNDPSTFVWTTDATGVSQQNGSWTFSLPTPISNYVSGYDYFADVYVNPKAITLWMNRGYTTLTLKVNAKDGEYLGIKLSETITLTEKMKTDGYKYHRFYVAPRNSGGGYGEISGYVVGVDLGGYTEAKPVTYLYANNVGEVTYDSATNSWTFARTARSYTADPYVLEDFDQKITVCKEAIAKWIAEGKTSMHITISDKDGENSLDSSSKITKDVTLADYANADYSFTQYMAVRGTDGITGFKITITFG